jgi:hypothetical protein
MSHLARMSDIKTSTGEKGDTNNGKIRLYMEFADGFIYGLLTNVKDIVIPLTAPTEHLRDLATALATAYFYKFESGDKDLAEAAELNVTTWFNSKYNIPRFKASAGTTL